MPFTPFDDTQYKPKPPSPTRDGYNTFAWDKYRQGIEIINDRFRFMGMQPKIWSGNVDGSTSIVTYGQVQGVIAENPLGLESKFLDLPKFNVVAYISMGDAYPMPIEMNEGPSQNAEAVIEPLAIPFRRHINEGPYYAHAIRGNLEDGNSFDSYVVPSSNRIEQFVEYAQPITSRFFLDEGGDMFGNIIRDAFVADIERKIAPFDDTLQAGIENTLQTSDETFKRIIRESSIHSNSMLPFGKKSACAGYSFYGPNAARYGTDSIAFGGWSLGS